MHIRRLLMIARVGYAALAVALLTLAGFFAARVYMKRRQAFPVVDVPPEIAGRSCEEGLQIARQLTKNAALDRARLAYLWLVRHCDHSPIVPNAMLEAASLLGHLLGEPRQARLMYEQFLHRFPDRPEAGDAMYQLARLEIDAGDYAAAVAHLTTLAQRYPNSWHEESAKFLAAKTADMLAAERHSRRTLLGQLAQLVPNNFVSLLALLTAVGPSIIQAVSRGRSESANPGRRSPWVLTSFVVGLTLLNYVINNVDSARRNRLLMEKLDRLTAASAQGWNSQ